MVELVIRTSTNDRPVDAPTLFNVIAHDRRKGDRSAFKTCYALRWLRVTTTCQGTTMAPESNKIMDTKKVWLNTSALTWRLSLIAALLVAANIGTQMFRFRFLAQYDDHVWVFKLIDQNREHNIPALFSVVLLLSAALLLGLIATLERMRQSGDFSKWVILTLGFLLMGLDESVSIHEGLIRPMRNLLGGQDLGIFYFAWVIPGIALVAALGMFFLPFLFRLPRRTAIAFAISAAIYLGGALGVELAEGAYGERHGIQNLTFNLLVSLEEGMEMAGVITFIHALMDYIARHYGEVRFGFGGVGVTAPDAMEPGLGKGEQSKQTRSSRLRLPPINVPTASP